MSQTEQLTNVDAPIIVFLLTFFQVFPGLLTDPFSLKVSKVTCFVNHVVTMLTAAEYYLVLVGDIKEYITFFGTLQWKHALLIRLISHYQQLFVDTRFILPHN